MLKWLPWTAFEDDVVHFWVHYGLVIAGFVLAVITFVVQWRDPAPYGKFESQTRNWGFMIPQRLGHMISDSITGVLVFLLVFFLYGNQRGYANITFVCLFEAHYIHRGIIHPWIMKYSNPKVPVGIIVGTFFPNLLYHYIQADWVGSAKFVATYYYDPRFIIGILLFITGYIINRWADWKLRSLRGRKGSDDGYFIPHGGLFERVACPNYFGEFVEWLGWAICTWSLAGLVWWMFCSATFIARSWHTLNWYKSYFGGDYPQNRKALIPFIF